MARSSNNTASEKSVEVRGFVPPQSDEERTLMRHAEDLARTAMARGIARYSSFLSDREQALCEAAMNRAGCEGWRFWGGYDGAERAVLCIEPEDTWEQPPIACVQITCRRVGEAALPAHKDYLGSLMGLNVKREGIGDILPNDTGAHVFALEPIAKLICEELLEVGRISVSCTMPEPEQWPVAATTQRELKTATVASLRLDAVLAAMLHCSRGQAAELIRVGRVEINHVAAGSPGAAVYRQDIFTVRGKGRFELVDLPGKSKKDRQIISFYQF